MAAALDGCAQPTSNNSLRSLNGGTSGQRAGDKRAGRDAQLTYFERIPFPHEVVCQDPAAAAFLNNELERIDYETLLRFLDAPTSDLPRVSMLDALPKISEEVLHSPVATVVGDCVTNGAGRWIWIAFRGAIWAAPPPFIVPRAPPRSLQEKLSFVPLPTELPRTDDVHRHVTEFRPKNAPKDVRLLLLHYKCASCMDANGTFRDAKRTPAAGPATSFPPRNPGTTRPADVKLGGMCCDLPWQCVAHVVQVATRIDVSMVDVFGSSQSGRCCLWLRDPQQTDLLLRRLVGRIWLAPAAHGYAVIAPDAAAKTWLNAYVAWLRHAGITRVPFPRHLLTAERWKLGAQKYSFASAAATATPATTTTTTSTATSPPMPPSVVAERRV